MGETAEIIKEISKEKIKTHIKNLEGIRHPVFAPEALEKAKEYIWENLESYGYEMSIHQFEDNGKQYDNVLGLHKGLRQPNQKIIVMAHFDTVSTSPGANDNASGIASVLELGRVFKNHKFEKSILFVGVNLEEQRVDGEKGSPICRGSKALATHARANGWEINGVLNFEEIAFAGDSVVQEGPENLPVEFPEIGDFIAVVGNEYSAEMVKNYLAGIEKYKISLSCFPLIVPGNGEILPDTRRSDHAPFWDNDYQAIVLTDTANFRTPHYHKPSDTLETINLEFATDVCRSGGVLIIEMATLTSI